MSTGITSCALSAEGDVEGVSANCLCFPFCLLCLIGFSEPTALALTARRAGSKLWIVSVCSPLQTGLSTLTVYSICLQNEPALALHRTVPCSLSQGNLFQPLPSQGAVYFCFETAIPNNALSDMDGGENDEALKVYMKGLELVLGGNETWSEYTRRYHEKD